MFFSKAKNKAQNAPRGRTVLGTLFSPEIGATLRPMGESIAVFLHLLASVFATQGLFPRNHPALSGAKDAPRLTLFGIIGTARSNLVLDKDHLPQIILFFGVIAILGFSGIAIFMIMLSVFMGTAHAAPTCATGMFSPCSAGQDVALGWINYLFFPNSNDPQTLGALYYYGPAAELPQSNIVQQALITALGFYSKAILVVAALILFYHLAAMIVQTAHDGVIMGKKANQVWAPIRLVFAIGLLVPLAGGLNSGQYIVLQVAKWGSGMADQMWNQFLKALIQDTAGLVPPEPEYAIKAVKNTILSQACMAIYNARIDGWSGKATKGALNDDPTSWKPSDDPYCDGSLPSNWFKNPENNNKPEAFKGADMPFPPMFPQPAKELQDHYKMISYDTEENGKAYQKEGQALCGSYSFPPPTPQPVNGAGYPVDTFPYKIQKEIEKASHLNFDSLKSTVQSGIVTTGITPFIDKCLGGANDVKVSLLDTPIQSYVGTYMSDMYGDFKTIATDLDVTTELKNVQTVSTSQGWVSAGAWWNTIARLQGDLMDISHAVPDTKPPQLEMTDDGVYNRNVLPVLRQFNDWMSKLSAEGAAGTPPSGLPSGSLQMLIAETGLSQRRGDDKDKDSYFDFVFRMIDVIASQDGVWTSSTPDGPFTLGVQFGGANPMAAISKLGFSNLKAAQHTFDKMIALNIDGGAASAAADELKEIAKKAQAPDDILAKGLKFSGTAGLGIGSALGTISVVFFSTGFMLAFYLPLVPFFYFLFNTLTWTLSLFEAIIAIPLVALAHLNPEGDGLPGGAKQAYFYIFNIFLRPVLMVFGLIAGYLLFYIAVSYMDTFYHQAIAGSGALNNGHAALAKLLYSIIYVVMLYMCANNCFKLITFLPDNALRWMGQQGLSYGSITGDPTDIEGKMTGIGAYFDQQLVSGASGASKSVGEAIGRDGVGTPLPRIATAGLVAKGGAEALHKLGDQMQGAQEHAPNLIAGMNAVLGDLMPGAQLSPPPLPPGTPVPGGAPPQPGQPTQLHPPQGQQGPRRNP